jgi:hypothetical protein
MNRVHIKVDIPYVVIESTGLLKIGDMVEARNCGRVSHPEVYREDVGYIDFPPREIAKATLEVDIPVLAERIKYQLKEINKQQEILIDAVQQKAMRF